jgi:hypothetical protein
MSKFVWGLGFGVWSLEFGVWSLEIEVEIEVFIFCLIEIISPAIVIQREECDRRRE